MPNAIDERYEGYSEKAVETIKVNPEGELIITRRVETNLGFSHLKDNNERPKYDERTYVNGLTIYDKEGSQTAIANLTITYPINSWSKNTGSSFLSEQSLTEENVRKGTFPKFQLIGYDKETVFDAITRNPNTSVYQRTIMSKGTKDDKPYNTKETEWGYSEEWQFGLDYNPMIKTDNNGFPRDNAGNVIDNPGDYVLSCMKDNRAKH